MATYATLTYDDRRAPVGRITLDRPGRRNALGPEAAGELVHALRRAQQAPEIRVVVLTGAGRFFSAGTDVGPPAAPGDSAPFALDELLACMHTLGKPIVAMVNGPATAAGFGLAAACDVVLASTTARFALIEPGAALPPPGMIAEIAMSLGRRRTLELALTGKRLAAREAERLGLVNRVVAPARLEPEALRLARLLAARGPAALGAGLRAVHGLFGPARGPAGGRGRGGGCGGKGGCGGGGKGGCDGECGCDGDCGDDCKCKARRARARAGARGRGR